MYPSRLYIWVFRSNCSTRQVYEEAAKDVALSVAVDSIQAYSPMAKQAVEKKKKTYTMTGITEYAIADIYDYIQKRGTIVEKLTEETLRDWNHVIQLLSICEAQRQIGETALNETSSRSHQIIRLAGTTPVLFTVNFVDLAGSERASQLVSWHKAERGLSHKSQLADLGHCYTKGRNGHIPFRDSKLTRILQPSLGGNDYEALLREKNRQIEQMEKEIKDLTMQRDIAQTQVRDLRQLLEIYTGLLMQVGLRNYPNLRVQRSPGLSSPMQVSILSDTPSIDADIRTLRSDGHSRSSSEDPNYTRARKTYSRFIALKPRESSMKGKEEPNFPSPEESSKFLATMTAENGDKADKGTVSLSSEDYGRLVSPFTHEMENLHCFVKKTKNMCPSPYSLRKEI
ncbi:hypothetical protein HAX54_001309 [Datura stramonium]|uniref:Kinesin motor domain-containing protein n=1 Tax=Datura stramonium TaxID=4076 RepID=A0ABS8RSE9_DATST|nr:hypothetical protein [Datura stramonium]